MDNLDVITLEQLKARPKGSAFLGVTNCQVPGQLLSINGLETQIIVDSGSDITLISLDTLSKLSPRPKPKIGEEIELGQISGKLKISTYVELPIYFRTDQGPVLMNVEAYVVPKMAPSFILGLVSQRLSLPARWGVTLAEISMFTIANELEAALKARDLESMEKLVSDVDFA
jgi:hypothetical protein